MQTTTELQMLEGIEAEAQQWAFEEMMNTTFTTQEINVETQSQMTPIRMEHRPYANERHEQFCREIEANTPFEIEHYKGRWFYDGPAVFIEANELQDVIRATTVRVQTDEMGKTGLVVYPR